jgi:hypothetical protein
MNLPGSDRSPFDPVLASLRQLLTRFAVERTPPSGRPNIVDEDPFEYRVSPHCYPGLRSFNPTEDRFFFGRQRNITEIRNKLAAERIVVVQGGSGTGKSSVIRAGLIPRLRDTDAIQGRHGNWYAAEFRPRTDPIGNLADGLGELIARAFPDQLAAIDGGGHLDPKGAPDVDRGVSSVTLSVSRRLKARFNEIIEGSASETAPEVRRTIQAAALLRVLRDVAAEIEQRDVQATRGLRAGPANLLLLIDQFEEVFRPEAQSSSKYLLDLLIATYSFLTQTLEGQTSGLFIVVTMRTEELHRVGEYPALVLPANQIVGNRHTLSLADVVNTSFYLIQVMDPDQDREELKEAIVAPAREVLGEYGLLRDDLPDTPLDIGVVDWLLDGVKVWRDSAGQNRKADQLPLLQHALRAMWEAALARWGKAIEQGEAELPGLLVGKQDLPASAASLDAADLAYCLDHRADQAKERAKAAFVQEVGEEINELGAVAPAGEAALRAAIRALARRDDRGNWARRFASVEFMDDFMAADPATASLASGKRRAGLARALGVLIAEGYISRDNVGDFDISHEALIRNWATAGAWLRETSDTASAIERVLQDVDPSLIGVVDKAREIEELIPRQVAERLAPIAGLASSYEIASGNEAIIGLPVQWSREQIRLLIGTHEVRKGWGSEDEALTKIQMARKQANDERHRQNEREKWRERIKWGLPILVGGLLAFVIVLSNAYSSAKEAKLGAWALSVVGWATSVQSDAYENGTRMYDIEQIFERVPRQITDSSDNDKLLKQASEAWDFGARYTLEASLTLLNTEHEYDNIHVICWSKNHSPNLDENHLKIGINKTPAKVDFQNDGRARIVSDGPSTKDQELVEWDADQLSAYQNIDKFPDHTRICISGDASTMIVASPSSPLQAFSLLWRTTVPGSFKMRGWPIWVRSGYQPPVGKLACVRGINEARVGTAVTTKILYDILPEAEDCQPAQTAQQAAAFVRGLFTPVELSSKEEGATKFLKCEKSPSDETKDPIRHKWSCETKSTGALIDVIITEPRSNKDLPNKDRPNLSLFDPVGNEISGGPISIDETIMPKEGNGDLILPNEVNIGCYDGSISVLITTGGKENRTWAYVVGAKAIHQLLADLATKNPHLQDKDPTNLIKNQPGDWLLTLPSSLFYWVVHNIKSPFQGDPPSLCA